MVKPPGEPRWLTDAQQQAWRALLGAMRVLSAELEQQVQRDAGLGQGDFEVLVRLSEADGGRIRMSDLADQVWFSRSRLSHAISRLESAGIVERRVCPTDKRGTYAALTPKGRRLVQRIAPDHVAMVRSLVFDRLDERQVAELQTICRTIVDAAGPRAAEAACGSVRPATAGGAV